MNDYTEEELDEGIEEFRITLEEHFKKFNFTTNMIMDKYSNRPFIQAFVTRRVVTNHVGVKTYVHPSTWWQHFKQSFYPEWLLDIFPVKTKTVEFSFRAIFPDYKPPKDDLLSNYIEDVSRSK